MAVIIRSPSGNEHAIKDLDVAVQTFVIATDQLTKTDYQNILQRLKNDRALTYRHNGWMIFQEVSSRRGTRIFASQEGTFHTLDFMSIRECAMHFNVSESTIQKTLKSHYPVIGGYRLRRADGVKGSNKKPRIDSSW